MREARRAAATPGRGSHVERGWWAGERGSAAAEITLLTPLLLSLLVFMVFLGRVTEAHAALTDAAHEAARAASITRDPATADLQARQAATTALTGRGLTCQHLTVAVDLAADHPGGLVRVTVTCVVGLQDLALLAVPGSRTLSASFTSPVDTYRGNALGFVVGEPQLRPDSPPRGGP